VSPLPEAYLIGEVRALSRVNLTCKPLARRSGEQQEARDQSVTLGRNQATNVFVRVVGMGTQVIEDRCCGFEWATSLVYRAKVSDGRSIGTLATACLLDTAAKVFHG
jgi:hypothetical protein